MRSRKHQRDALLVDLQDRLLNWCDRHLWSDRLNDIVQASSGLVARAFGLSLQQAIDEIGDDLLFLFGDFVFHAFLGSSYGPEGAIASDAYLKANRWRLTPLERTYLEAVRDTRPSLYEVRSAEPGGRSTCAIC